MSTLFNIYCDESCHLEKDRQPVMVLGAVWCPKDRSREISVRLREIKHKHHIPPRQEVKWTKVSPSKEAFYLDLLDYFFDDDDLHFRGVLIPNKSKLNHDLFGQTHDDWYYKMFFELLNVIIDPLHRYHVYLDIKDTWSRMKVAKLHKVLSNAKYDFSRHIIERIQTVRSHEVEMLQLADLLIGAVGYVNRNLSQNHAKVAFVERMKKRSGRKLTATTLLRESKVNLLRWEASEPLL
ncbi:MAG TPA: DUF3800 domain-containing protein [Candidatus Hydrogenedentes bacterium]|nr:DUF3800 domain-containing protein [Candidatus Hydrogenedentota bacterium]